MKLTHSTTPNFYKALDDRVSELELATRQQEGLSILTDIIDVAEIIDKARLMNDSTRMINGAKYIMVVLTDMYMNRSMIVDSKYRDDLEFNKLVQLYFMADDMFTSNDGYYSSEFFTETLEKYFYQEIVGRLLDDILGENLSSSKTFTFATIFHAIETIRFTA